MKTCIIACETIRRELELICGELAISCPVFWLESGLHNFPERLKEELQKKIDAAQDYDRILLAMGYCGNSIEGIRAGHAELIVPRADDCISLLLGSVSNRREITRNCGTYFFTKGWLDGEKNLWAEYQYTVEKYGEKRAKRIMARMLHNYERLGVLDMNAYPVEELLPQTREIAEVLGLRHEVLPASKSYIKKLLTGPWEAEQFLTVQPGDSVKAEDLMRCY